MNTFRKIPSFPASSKKPIQQFTLPTQPTKNIVDSILSQARPKNGIDLQIYLFSEAIQNGTIDDYLATITHDLDTLIAINSFANRGGNPLFFEAFEKSFILLCDKYARISTKDEMKKTINTFTQINLLHPKKNALINRVIDKLLRDPAIISGSPRHMSIVLICCKLADIVGDNQILQMLLHEAEQYPHELQKIFIQIINKAKYL